MIKIQSVHKYYNKNRSNEIHVINNTSIEFPQTGLVALTGASGSGKTTLLNVIGGLDSFHKGAIEIDGVEMKSYKAFKWDLLRNKYVGYIFQNYNLIQDKTVWENVEIALNMAGLYDANLIEERVKYVLQSVGMYKYRKRNVQALSGGQQQRVAIARAIAKNPQVVLADEPTGNLDVNNTFEVMSIIKKISETCLVILVTHEKELVDLYADRVIELKDGVIENDTIRTQNGGVYNRVDERAIYLKDLQKQEGEGPVPVTYYYDKELTKQPKVEVIYTKNKIFVKVISDKKVQYVTDDSEIRLIDAHYEAVKTDDIKHLTFDMSSFPPIEPPKNRRSFMRFSQTIWSAFKKVLGPRKRFGKVIMFAYFVISGFLAYNFATLSNINKMDEKEFLKTPRDMVAVTITDDFTLADVNTIIGTDEILDVSMSTQSSGFYTGYGDFYQGEMNYSWSKRVDMFPYLVNNFDGITLTYGEYPTAEGEIAIDEWVVDQMLDNNMYGSLGASEYKDFLGMTVADKMGSNYTVVGIIQTESPIFILPVGVPYYGDSNGMYMSFMPKNDLLEYEILYGHDLQSSGEVLLSEFDWIVQEAENPADVIGQDYPYDTNYTIAGIYRSESMYVAIVSLEDYRDAVLSQRIEYAKTDWAIWEGYSTTLLFYTNDMDQAIQHLTDLGYTATDVYTSSKETYMANRFDQYAGQLRFIFISLAGIGVYVFLMMRSSMLSRIKEIGIYRAIGATKRDIYKIFLSEIIAFTTVGSMIGYVLVSATVWQVQHQLLSWGLAAADLYFPLPYFLGGAAIIFLVNILFGLLPIFNLLRKTPSEILAKYDI